jgi:hypothetical protein
MRLVTTFTLCFLVACGTQDSEPAPAEVQTDNAPAPIQAASPTLAAPSATQRAPTLPATGLPQADAPGDPGAADGPTPHAIVDPNAAGLAEVRETGEAIEAALNAAAEAGGDTTCERGYNNLVAMVRELRERVGTSGQRNPPEHDAFVEACDDLPPEVQECLVLSYALAHRADCEVRKDSLDPEVRARIRALMSGGASEPSAR